ncbi:hypothetical protein AVEN_47084-1 [Araneus ventricosus]|uniref:Uncharacterized protein n=1 Tax=Araneus ventricosus TaxID=182803 RepID=A0A4Y2LH66_ARAVE|nr:hypothetical protein AVEN_47084-1 [Araneus ventricosus]
MTYKKEDEDANCLIVKALGLAPTHPSVVVIEPGYDPEAVVDVGNRFLVALHGYPITTSDTPSLNNVCYKCYMKSSFNESSNMASLRSCPPTFSKVYYQIQH